MSEDKFFTKELRDAALWCSNPVYRHELRRAADDVDAWLSVLAECPTQHTLKCLNGEWAKAARLLANVPAEADPNPPLAGAPEAARLAA